MEMLTVAGVVALIIGAAGLLFVYLYFRTPTSRTVEVEAPIPPPPAAIMPGPDEAERAGLVIEGVFRLREDFSMPGTLLVRGTFDIGAGVKFGGSAYVEGDVILGDSARVEQPMRILGNLDLARNATVPTCRVGGDVKLGPGATIEGRLDCHALVIEEDEPEEPMAAPVRQGPRSTKRVEAIPFDEDLGETDRIARLNR